MTEPTHPQPEPEANPTPAQRVINSEDLLRGEREIWIEHEGERYRLRLTRRGKLILQK